ncbi:unnamed protein product [Sphagnum troendelagicum]
MAEVVRNLKQFIMICLTLDGATNVHGKQIINMMACGPMAFFLEHFSMDLCRESVENLYEKLIDCKRRLLLTIRKLAPRFVSHVVSSDANDDDADPQQVAALNEHFVRAPMFTFCSDSPSVMIKLRRLCIQDIEFLFVFDCSSHAPHNLCMDLVKEFLIVKLIVKQIVFLVKSVPFLKGVAAVEVLFSAICSCMSYLEGDESTFSSVYAYFLAVAHHFRTLLPDVRAALDLSSADVDKMHTLVCLRPKTIFSPAHALTFRTDPLFNDLRDNLAKLHRDAFFNLGDLTILQ